jgi:hypothetical protein
MLVADIEVFAAAVLLTPGRGTFDPTKFSEGAVEQASVMCAELS